MLGLETLDVLIGLVTIYLVFGLALTAIVEAVATWLKLRSNNLDAALREFFAGELKAGQPFLKAFYDHPLVQTLSKGKDGRPSYIPSEIVAQVVEGLLTATGSAGSLAAAVATLPGTVQSAAQSGTAQSAAAQPGKPETNRIKGLLDVLVTQSGGDVAVFRKAVEKHYEATMERASGWFKRHTQTAALVGSAVLVICANVDTAELAVSLASNPEARVKMVDIARQNLNERQTALNQAESGKTQGPVTLEQAKADTDRARQTLARANSDMATAGLRIGWTNRPSGAEWLTKIAGLLVSIFAVSLERRSGSTCCSASCRCGRQGRRTRKNSGAPAAGATCRERRNHRPRGDALRDTGLLT